MTDYNDGKIHGWNGGECPVHPKTRVLYWTRSNGRTEECGGALNWTHREKMSDIIAFQVTKVHREPKTIWVNEYRTGKLGYDREDIARGVSNGDALRVAVKYQEVQP